MVVSPVIKGSVGAFLDWSKSNRRVQISKVFDFQFDLCVCVCERERERERDGHWEREKGSESERTEGQREIE